MRTLTEIGAGGGPQSGPFVPLADPMDKFLVGLPVVAQFWANRCELRLDAASGPH